MTTVHCEAEPNEVADSSRGIVHSSLSVPRDVIFAHAVSADVTRSD